MDEIDTTALEARGFEIVFRSHARAILAHDFFGLWQEIGASLLELTIPIEEIVGSGGGEAKGTQRLRRSRAARGWKGATFTIEKRINKVPSESISHKMDHVRASANGVIALEIEWNNKDPFFDRDLENFKRLHAEGAISARVIVTRGSMLQDSLGELVARFVAMRAIQGFADLDRYGYSPTRKQRAAIEGAMSRKKQPLSFAESFVRKFVADKYGAATTHWEKLMDRIARGVGNPCPLLLVGLPASLVTFNEDPAEVAELLAEIARESD